MKTLRKMIMCSKADGKRMLEIGIGHRLQMVITLVDWKGEFVALVREISL